jgi:dolichol-phosphate mannosyltransferase
LLEPDEARYAEIPRQMLADGNWLVPTLHDQPYVHKPPLLYWLVMASYSLFGVHDWAARIVPGIAGVLMVAIAYLWGRRTLGFRPGLFGAIMLATSVRFLYLGRMLNMDGILGLCVLCGWSAGYLATRDTRLRWRWWSLSAVATAFGVLTKGPVALVLVLIPFILLTLLDDRRARLGVRGLSGFAAIVAGIATPWFLLVAAASPGFNREFLWTHNLQRFFAPLDHEEPVWYFLPGLLLGMMPWTLLLPTLLKGTFRPTGIRASRRPAALGFVLLCVLWTLTFFSLSGCKRPAYILPAMPPLALALGYALHAMLPVDLLARVRTMSAAWTGQLAYRTTQAVTFAGIVAGIVACVSGLISDQAAAALTIAGAAFLAIIHWTSPRRHVGAAWAICAATTATLLMVGLHLLMPGYERRFALRAEVSAQQAAVANPSIPVVCYPRRWDSVSFYLRRGDVQVFGPRQWPEMVAELRRQPSTLVFIKSDNAHSQPLKEFLGQLPASLEFTPLARHGIVTAGVVQRRAEAPSTVLARR